MDPQTLLSLIVFIAYGIYSLYAATQEAKKKKQAVPEEAEPELTIEEELRKYFGETFEEPMPGDTAPPKAAPMPEMEEQTEEWDESEEEGSRPELMRGKEQKKLFDTERGEEESFEDRPEPVSLAAEREELVYESLADEQYKDRPRKDIFQQLRDEAVERKRRAVERAKKRRAKSAFGKSFSFNVRDAVIYNIIMENKFQKRKF